MSNTGDLQTGSGKVPRAQYAMVKDVDTDSLLDLSFLTEEEQTRIVDVLSRDVQLRRKDEGRIRKIRQTVSDPSQLKTMTGDWFCDIRAGRYRSRKQGSDIIKASIRRKKKPKGERERAPWPAVVTGDEAADRAPEEAVPLLQPVEPQDIQDSTNAADSSLKEEGASQQQVEKAPLEPAKDTQPSLSAKEGGEQQMGENQLSPVIITVQSDDEELDEHQQDSPDRKGNTLELPYNPMKTSSSLQSLGSTTKLSGSIMSLYSDGEIGNVEVRGCIQFSLQFDSRKKELLILIIQCRDLAEAKKQRSDPYVKTYLLPDKSSTSKRKTGVKKRCLDPFFNETLKYKIEKADLQSRILNMSVWHHDVLGRNLFLGEVEIELHSWDWNQTHPVWFNLQPRMPVAPGVLNSRGKLVLSLKFIPSGSEGGGLPPTGELHIWVKEAQNLLPIRTGTMDSFVKCYVLPDDSKLSRQKTRVIKRSLSPLFNHTMVYDGFRVEDLQEACAEFTLWDKEKRSTQQLGGVRLSLGHGSSYGMVVPWMDSTEDEKSVWNTLIQKPNEWVDARLPLRTNLTPRV